MLYKLLILRSLLLKKTHDEHLKGPNTNENQMTLQQSLIRQLQYVKNAHEIDTSLLWKMIKTKKELKKASILLTEND